MQRFWQRLRKELPEEIDFAIRANLLLYVINKLSSMSYMWKGQYGIIVMRQYYSPSEKKMIDILADEAGFNHYGGANRTNTRATIAAAIRDHPQGTI